MSINAAIGAPQYGGIDSSKTRSKRLLANLYGESVVPFITNTDYQGAFQNQGDTVIVRRRPTVTWRDYKKNGEMSFDIPPIQEETMTIEHAKYFGLQLDKVDSTHTDVDWLPQWEEDAVASGKELIDTQVLAALPAYAHSSNSGSTAGVRSASYALGTTAAGVSVGTGEMDAMNLLLKMAAVLTEQNVPQGNRFCVIPEWFWVKLMGGRLSSANLMGDATSALRNGKMGELAGFTLYRSNFLSMFTDSQQTPKVCTNIVFGHKMATSFAATINHTDRVNLINSFGVVLRGLMTFGYKTFESKALGVCRAYAG